MNPFDDTIALVKLERAEASRLLDAQGGRGVALAEQIDRLDEQIRRMEDATALACPNCGEYDCLSDVTMYPGLCDGTFARLADGTVDFAGDGETDIAWESGKAPKGGKSVECDCGWSGKPSQLVEYSPDDEDGQPIECEDCDVNGQDCRTHGAAYRAAQQAIAADPDKTRAVLIAAGLAEEEA